MSLNLNATNKITDTMKALADRSAQVIVVEPSDSIRLILSEGLRASGFQKITSMSSLEDATAYLETDTGDVILSSLFAEEKGNLLAAMRLCTTEPQLAHILFIATAEAAETNAVLKAYEMGLLAHIFKPFSSDSARSAIAALLAHLASAGWDSTLTAARYLREILKERSPPALLELAKNLAAQYPGEPVHLLEVAGALLRNRDEAGARSTLWQMATIDPSLMPAANELLAAFLGPEGEPIEKRQFSLGIAGVKTAVVVDADTTVLRQMEATLKEQAVENVLAFEDGKQCWDWLDGNAAPDLLVQEWRLPEVSGAALLQRVRGAGASQTMIIVASSLLKRSDHPLLVEMGVDITLEKPVSKNDLINAIVWLVKQDRFVATRSAMEAKIRRLLRAKGDPGAHAKEARQIQLQLVSPADTPASTQKRVEAEFAFFEGKFLDARNLILESLKTEKNNPYALNLMAKCLLKLRDFKSALKFFEKAKEYSPANIERLCLMAEAKIGLNDLQGASEELAEAAAVDRGNEQVKETTAMVALAQGDARSCRRVLQTLESVAAFVTFANNRAVALVADDQIPEAISLYRTCLQSLAKDDTRYRGYIAYNLGLALCRQELVHEAKETLEAINLEKLEYMRPKVASLLRRIASAIQSGDKVQLFLSSPVLLEGDLAEERQPTPDPEAIEASQVAPPPPPRKCCVDLYQAEDADDKTKAMLATKMTFTKRSALQKP